MLGVKVEAYFLQRMKTRWGSCNPKAGHIRLNTELVKKPRDLIVYVVVHEMIHLLEPTHNTRFLALLSEHYPAWRAARCPCPGILRSYHVIKKSCCAAHHANGSCGLQRKVIDQVDRQSHGLAHRQCIVRGGRLQR